MDTKVQELADKIYREGVQKASFESEEILKNARLQSEKLLADAEEKATRIVAEAQAKAREVRENAEAELKLSTQQAIESLRTEVTDMVNAGAILASVDKAFADPKALLDVVKTMAQQWATQQEVVISTDQARQLEQYFVAEASAVMGKGIRIEEVNGHPHTFELSPANGSYKIVIGKEAFVEYFKEFMRPKLRAYLFGTAQEK